MAKMRVHELAKEISKSSKEVLAVLRQNGVDIQSHMSTVTDEQAAAVRASFTKAQQPAQPKKPAEREQKEHPARETARRPQEGAGRESQRPRSEGQREGRRPRSEGQREGQRPRSEGQREGVRRDFSDSDRDRRRPRSGEARGQEGRPAGNREGRERTAGSRENRGRVTNFRNDRKPGDDRRSGEGRRDGRSDRPVSRDRRDGRPAGNRDGRDNRDNRGQRGGQRPDSGRPQREGGRDNRRGEGRRAGFQDSVAGMKETRSSAGNRHDINREHSRDNDRQNNGDSRGRGGRRNNAGKKNDFNNNGGQKRTKNRTKQQPAPQPKKQEPKEDVIRNITLPDPVSLKDLADACKVAPSVIIKKLFLAGKMVTINTEFSFDDAAEIALEYNCIAEEEVQIDVIEELLKEEDEDESLLEGRPPVVCVMGHVDHGKTSLLDAIRSTNVTAGEAGGITQHIGASVVSINGQKITFLDTPGHEAFTSMRLRGAQATDIAVLVVAADDGVMPQTIEAINHAKAAEVEVIVAVNKIDKEGANVDRVKQELTEYGLIAEDWGGDTVFVPVSAKTGEGIDDLLEMIILTAEVMELKANPNRKARGLVIEAKLDKGRGPVATILIQKGTLSIGDSISVGHVYGHVRAMIDDKGRRVKTAGPSKPVEILGLNDVPFSGEVMMAHASEKEARTTAEAFIAYGREKMLEDTKSKLSLDDLFSQIQAGNVKELNLVVKADVQGSVEAVRQSLLKLSNEEVKLQVIHGGVGAINESDVTLASASNAIIIGFNVRPDAMAKAAVEREKVDMRLYRVIYTAIEDIEAAMKGMLDPVFREKVIGHLDVRQIYKASGVGTIAGCYVTDGIVTRDSSARIVRDGIVIYEGALASLKRFKDDVKEVRSGFECGIVFEKYNDIKEGDQIESFVMEEVPR